MNVQRMRASTEAWPLSRPSKLGRQASIVKWAKGPRTYTMGNGRKVLAAPTWVAPTVEIAPKVQRKWMFA